MHTFVTSDNTVFIYNSDLSGELIIRGKDEKEISICCKDLARFIAHTFSDFGPLVDGLEEQYTWGSSHLSYNTDEVNVATVSTLQKIEVLK